MMAGGDPETLLSRISKTVAADAGWVERACRMAQKSGEVMISFLRGQGFSMHSFRPCRTGDEVFWRRSLENVEMLWSNTGTRT